MKLSELNLNRVLIVFIPLLILIISLLYILINPNIPNIPNIEISNNTLSNTNNSTKIIIPQSRLPNEIKPKEIKPKEIKPTEIKPKEIKPTEIKPTEINSNILKPLASKNISAKYGISTMILDKDVFVEISLITKSPMKITCKSYTNTSSPTLTKKQGSLYYFENTTCVLNEIINIEYTLPNSNITKIKMPLKYELSHFNFNTS